MAIPNTTFLRRESGDPQDSRDLVLDQSLVHIFDMEVSVSAAKAQLTDLVRRAEAGERVVLTRHGVSVATIEPVHRPVTVEQRRAALDALLKATEGMSQTGWPTAARSQDFLYDDDGLPG